MTNVYLVSEEVLRQVLDDVCGSRLCSVNSMSSRGEMLRLMGKAADELRTILSKGPLEPVSGVSLERGMPTLHSHRYIPEGNTPLYALKD